MTDQLLLAFRRDTGEAGLTAWAGHFATAGVHTTIQTLSAHTVLVVDDADAPLPDRLPPPAAVVRTGGGYRLARRALVPSGTTILIGRTVVGDGGIAVFAGPCAVESETQLLSSAAAVAAHGAVGLRGGAFKPRTSPYAFHGLAWTGLEMLAAARAATGLPIVTEVVDPRHVARVAETADALQIGARNMQNFSLLTEAGRSGMPVVLKRGFGTTVDELLSASEYLLCEGNDQVVLCERGVRTFEPATRFTLDLSAVALLKQRTHLPVIVDPSHSSGLPSLVEPLSLAAVAAGADALLIDVHADPERALCDGGQAILPDAFGRLMERLSALAIGLGRPMTTPTTVPEFL
jgi:3-deoxy-7-phosphoheptulonate synthase